MSARPLAIITTELPPATCGIGTYSWLLRKHWPGDARVVEFVVTKNAGHEVTPLGDNITVFGNRGRELARVLERLGDIDVLLHYAGRAYHRFGFPFWLPRAVQTRGGRLAVFVHEMPARFSPFSHHFWFGKLSLEVTRRLGAVADLLITNTTHHRDHLCATTGREDIHLLPIASNIEPIETPTQPRVRTEFVVFGLPFGRLQTLRLFERYIPQWHAAGVLTRLHIVGPRDDKFTPQADEIVRRWNLPGAITEHGALPAEEVSRLLRRAQFALTNVSEATWNQATVALAGMAHECSIVIAGPRPPAGPPAAAVSAEEVATISEAELAARAAAFAEWYRANAGWPVIARRMAEIWAERQ